MKVENIEITNSPISLDRTRVRADVTCDDKSIPPQAYWIDIPRAYSGHLSDSGNTWLTLLLPFAVHLGEPLEIGKPVDRELLLNAHELMRVWKCWHPNLRPVPIEADVQEELGNRPAGATATLFSGGVDSWFTLLRHNGDTDQPDRIRIDDVLRVCGLDIPLEDAYELGAMRDVLARATQSLGTRFVEVATNLRKTRWWMGANWVGVGHGCAFASIGHALSGRYSKVLIPSTHRYNDAVPWGTHPLTDPLLSSTLTKFTHDGAGFSRIEKTETVARSEAALNSLQVCWHTEGYRNCGRCSKCYITMTTLHLLGALDRCSRFNTPQIDKRKLAKLFVHDDGNRAFLHEIRALAVRTGKRDIGRAIDRSFRRSRRLDLFLRLAKKPLGLAGAKWRRRLDWRIERLLLRDSIV